MQTIRELSDGFRDGSLSPTDVTSRFLGRIDRLNPVLDCYITVLADSAMKQAAESEKRAKEGKLLGPLDGVPISIKDIIFIEGVRCTAGSKILADHVAAYDSPVVRRLKAAGAVILGTNNLHEFACGVTSVNPHYGAVHNPWDLDRIAGGSSGGSAAAVSAGLAAGSFGTDTAGSVRIPASLCGVVGLKPTYGRVSRVGVIPLAASLDVVGPLARSAWDAAALLGCVAGPDPGDLSTADVPVPDYLAELERPPPAKVGVPHRYFMDSVDPAVAQAFSSFLDRLAAVGCEAVPTELRMLDRVYDAWAAIRRGEATAFHEQWLSRTPEMYGSDVRKALEAGRDVPAVQYITAQNLKPSVREAFLGSMKGVDVIATPCTSIAAPKIGEESVKMGPRDVSVYSALNGLTLPFNYVGFPAASVPAGTVDGLPIGAQVAARPFEEGAILRLVSSLEAKFGPFPTPPAA